MRKDLSKLQPSKSGISYDYINEFAKVKSFINMYFQLNSENNLQKDNILVLKYEERYPSSEFHNIRTSQNSKTIDALDSIVNLINSILKNYFEKKN